MTTDNGHEFLNYDKIEISKYNKEERRTIVYYTDPYSSWQKGMNENCNGILRRFIPKGTDLNKVTSEKLEKILNKINGKPRKILGFISAEKRFNEEIEKIVA
ncbi:MAG: IS30 family transposase [Clostridia bacterium]